MTALEVSNKFGCAFVEGTSSEHWINAMKEYARLQIEKDRERVKGELIGVRPTLVFQYIDETPIILD